MCRCVGQKSADAFSSGLRMCYVDVGGCVRRPSMDSSGGLSVDVFCSRQLMH